MDWGYFVCGDLSEFDGVAVDDRLVIGSLMVGGLKADALKADGVAGIVCCALAGDSQRIR